VTDTQHFKKRAMKKRSCSYMLLAVTVLIVSGLACAVPTPLTTQPLDPTPFIPTSPSSDATQPPPTDAVPADPTAPETTEAPLPTDTEPPAPTATDAPPPPPPATTTPKPTETTEATLPPLNFEPPTGVDSWEDKGGGTYNVVLRVDIVGGVPPFTVSHGPTVQGTTEDRVYLIKFDWGSCKSAMVQSITVASSDGQEIKKNYFIAVANMPWCATPSP
jgi:hypothetical protein